MGKMLSKSSIKVDEKKANEMLKVFQQLTEAQKSLVLGYTFGLRDSNRK